MNKVYKGCATCLYAVRDAEDEPYCILTGLEIIRECETCNGYENAEIEVWDE